MDKNIKTIKNAFTWTRGMWISIRPNGLIYYSEDVTKSIFNENISYVSYEIDVQNNILSIRTHELEPENKSYSLTHHNNGARTFIKKELEANNYKLPDSSLRFYANVNEDIINIDISSLKF